MQLTDKEKEARNRYYREWREKNKRNIDKSQANFWAKKAEEYAKKDAEETADKDAEETTDKDITEKSQSDS